MTLELLESKLRSFLENDTIPLKEVLKSYDIELSLVSDLGSSVLGFVYYSRSSNYHLIINANIDLVSQRKTLLHEIKHIILDMPTIGYIIGMDINKSRLEIEADQIANNIISDM